MIQSPKKKNKKKSSLPTDDQLQQAREELKHLLAHEPGESGSYAKEEANQETKIKVEAVPDSPSVERLQPEQDEPSHQEIVRNFSALYSEGKTGKSDMSVIERREVHRGRKIAFIIVVLLVLLAAAAAGFYFFVNQQPTFTGEAVAISLNRPTTVTAGEAVTFTVVVANNEAVDLNNAELTIRIPDTFTFQSSVPAPLNESHNAWEIGTVKAGRTKEVTITGQFSGGIGSTTQLSSLLSYYPENYSAEFQASETLSIIINNTAVSLTINTPANVISDREASYIVNITNTSPEMLRRLRLTMRLPADMVVASFDPDPADPDTLTWEIPTLNSQEKFTVDWQASVSGAEGSTRELNFQVDSLAADGTYYPQAEETSILFITNPDFQVSLAVNDGATDTTASFGDRLDYSIIYKNNTQSRIKNMVISISFTGEVLDWDKLIDIQKGTVDGQTITWDASSVSDLAIIEPGDEGKIDFSLPLVNNIVVQHEDDINYTIVSQAQAVSSEVTDLEGTTMDVKSNLITVAVNSRLDLRVEGRYYDDEYVPVGSGPLPPEVGETTTYRLYWYVQNNTNEVDDVAVTATIPETVVWTDEYARTAGDISYDDANRTVSWTINKVPAHVGQLIPELSAHFDVSVTPVAADVGMTVPLLNQTTITAVDSFTKVKLNQTADLVTTKLPGDPLAADKGTVIKSETVNNSNKNINTSVNSHS